MFSGLLTTEELKDMHYKTVCSLENDCLNEDVKNWLKFTKALIEGELKKRSQPFVVPVPNEIIEKVKKDER